MGSLRIIVMEANVFSFGATLFMTHHPLYRMEKFLGISVIILLFPNV